MYLPAKGQWRRCSKLPAASVKPDELQTQILTANNLNTISSPFLNCMKVLKLSEYVVILHSAIWDLGEDTHGLKRADIEEQWMWSH
jgi:hypothetical protein